MTVLLCPLCSQPRFSNLESLRLSLINAATQSISCPICNEILLGLDKLTIHLFGHSLDQNPDRNQCMELKLPKLDDVIGKAEIHPSKAETEDTTHVGNLLDVESNVEVMEHKSKSPSSTVNMEDLSFLTSWENSLRGNNDSESKSLSPALEKEESSKTNKEDTTELSEYMSDLLNKKLPILNFVFTMDEPEEEKKPEKPTEDEVPDKQFRCPTCDFSFQNSIVLSMHQEFAHSKSKVDKNVQEQPEPLVETPPIKAEESSSRDVSDVLKDFVLPAYDCHLCSKSFKMKGSLLVHYRVAHLGATNTDSVLPSQADAEERNFHCSICSKSFKKEQHLTQHIKTHEGKQWQCETCSKHFTTKYFLKKHQRLHTGEMPYSCQTCSKTFTFQQSYHKHLLYHSDEKPHQCSQCGRSFKELSTLHNHQRIHSGEKPFACETCGKCFRQRVSYIVHQRIHTGVLPYQCTACKKKFRYKVSQRNHKCTAQPPGIVIRQPGELIQRILERRNDVLQCSQ